MGELSRSSRPHVAQVRHILEGLCLVHQPPVNVFCQEAPASTTADLVAA